MWEVSDSLVSVVMFVLIIPFGTWVFGLRAFIWVTYRGVMPICAFLFILRRVWPFVVLIFSLLILIAFLWHLPALFLFWFTFLVIPFLFFAVFILTLFFLFLLIVFLAFIIATFFLFLSVIALFFAFISVFTLLLFLFFPFLTLISFFFLPPFFPFIFSLLLSSKFQQLFAFRLLHSPKQTCLLNLHFQF